MGANRRPAARLARWRRFALLLTAPLVLVAGGAVAAAPGPRPARGAVQTTTTRITWTGHAGFVLRVPAAFEVPHWGARLHLHRGSYAFVRRVPANCAPRCGWSGLTHLRGVWRQSDGPGTEHMGQMGDDDDVVRAGTYEFYLFTDGEATLEYDDSTLPGGTTHYRATGRISGHAEPLRIRCPQPTACSTTDGYGRKLFVGGQAHDVGRAGSVDVLVGSRNPHQLPASMGESPHSSMLRACKYDATPADPRGADPARYPWGCDRGGEPADTKIDVVGLAGFAASGAWVASGRWFSQMWPQESGRVYVGFQIALPVDLGGTQIDAWAVWFTYGIR